MVFCKAFVAVAAGTLLTASTAHAACSTAALAGSWRIFEHGMNSSSATYSANITLDANGKGAAGNYSFNLSASCWLSGTAQSRTGGGRLNVFGRSEAISPDSPLVPNILMFSGPNGRMFLAYRR